MKIIRVYYLSNKMKDSSIDLHFFCVDKRNEAKKNSRRILITKIDKYR